MCGALRNAHAYRLLIAACNPMHACPIHVFRLVRVLFELARFHAPSTIFMDEIDAIMSSVSGSALSITPTPCQPALIGY